MAFDRWIPVLSDVCYLTFYIANPALMKRSECVGRCLVSCTREGVKHGGMEWEVKERRRL